MHATAVLLALTLTAADEPKPYQLLKTINLPGDGGWDYLSVDDAGRRVYVSHGTEVVVLDADSFEVKGIGYPDADIVPLLRSVNTAFDPNTIHNAPPGEYRELDTGRRHAWAEDRVM